MHASLGGVDALEAVALGQHVELAVLVLAEGGDLVRRHAEVASVGDLAVLLDEGANRAVAVVAVQVGARERGDLRPPVHVAADGGTGSAVERVLENGRNRAGRRIALELVRALEAVSSEVRPRALARREEVDLL